MKNFIRSSVAAVGLLVIFSVSMKAANVLPSNWDLISTTGTVGVLRAGSPWGPGSSLGAQSSIVDGVFFPETTQWNSGSWWWDEDPSVNGSPVVTTIHMNQLFSIDSFTVQADDNDTYRLEYWDGSAWQLAWDIPSVASSGLVTRSSGLLPTFVTDELRFTATGGDNYYSVSEIQAFGTAAASVPEPATLTLLLFGIAGVGFARRFKLS